MIDDTYIEAGVEENVSECLCFAQNCINQDDNWIIFNVFVHWLLAGFLKTQRGEVNSSCCISLKLILQSNIIKY